MCQDRETILLAVNPKQKMQRLYVMYLLIYFFYSKIGPFTCKSNAFAEEYEKRDTTMALKEIYILQKGIEKHSNENLSFSAHFLSFVTTYTIN